MKVVTFGEIMLRLKTPEHLRILQTRDFEASYGGAEANVAVSLAMLEDPVSFVTKVPDNPIRAGSGKRSTPLRGGYFLYFKGRFSSGHLLF